MAYSVGAPTSAQTRLMVGEEFLLGSIPAASSLGSLTSYTHLLPTPVLVIFYTRVILLSQTPPFLPPHFIFLRDLIKGNLSSHCSINGFI